MWDEDEEEEEEAEDEDEEEEDKEEEDEEEEEDDDVAAACFLPGSLRGRPRSWPFLSSFFTPKENKLCCPCGLSFQAFCRGLLFRFRGIAACWSLEI